MPENIHLRTSVNPPNTIEKYQAKPLQDYKINIKRKRNSNGVQSNSSKKSKEKENKASGVAVVAVPGNSMDLGHSFIQKHEKFSPLDHLKVKSKYPLLSYK